MVCACVPFKTDEIALLGRWKSTCTCMRTKWKQSPHGAGCSRSAHQISFNLNQTSASHWAGSQWCAGSIPWRFSLFLIFFFLISFSLGNNSHCDDSLCKLCHPASLFKCLRAVLLCVRVTQHFICACLCKHVWDHISRWIQFALLWPKRLLRCLMPGLGSDLSIPLFLGGRGGAEISRFVLLSWPSWRVMCGNCWRVLFALDDVLITQAPTPDSVTPLSSKCPFPWALDAHSCFCVS